MSEDSLITLGVVAFIALIIGGIAWGSLREMRKRADHNKAFFQALKPFKVTGELVQFEIAGRQYRLVPGGKFLQLSRQGSSDAALQVRKKNTAIRSDMDLGAKDKISTGMARFDERYTLSADKPDYARGYVNQPEVAAAIDELMAMGCTDFRFDKEGVHINRFAGMDSLPADDKLALQWGLNMPPLLERLVDALPPIPEKPETAQSPSRLPAFNMLWILALMVLGFGLLVLGIYFFLPMEQGPVFYASLPLGLLIAVGLMVWGYLGTRQAMAVIAQRIMLIILSIPSGLVFSLGLIILLNGLLDFGHVQRHGLEIQGKTHYPGGLTSAGGRMIAINPAWTITLPHWEREGESFELHVSEGTFNRLAERGDHLLIDVSPGALGFEWEVARTFDYRQ